MFDRIKQEEVVDREESLDIEDGRISIIDSEVKERPIESAIRNLRANVSELERQIRKLVSQTREAQIRQHSLLTTEKVEGVKDSPEQKPKSGLRSEVDGVNGRVVTVLSQIAELIDLLEL